MNTHKLVGGALVLLVISGTASARLTADPFASLRGRTTVPNQELAHLRGRYVGFGQVQYFGVRMETRWRTSDGTLIQSALNLGIRGNGDARDRVGYSTHTSITPGTGTVGGGSDRGNVGANNINGQGVTQVIQLASDGNTANNNVQLNVTNNGNTPTLPAGTDNGSGTTTEGGIVVTAGLNAGGVGTNIVVAGQGRVAQQLNGNGGLLQNVLISSAANQVQNNLTLTLVLAPGTPLGGGGVPNEVSGTTLGIPGLGR